MMLKLTIFLYLVPQYFANIDMITDKFENCTCVPYYQCSDESGEVITDGKGLLDLRILENSPCTGYFDVCCNASLKILTTTEKPSKTKGCGYKNSGFFPWYASLTQLNNDDFPGSYRCGASIIHQKVLLTAAHCFNQHSNDTIAVRAGNALRKIEKIIVHPQFNFKTLHNDIALVILRDPIEVSEKISTICIPPQSSFLDNSKCRATVRVKNKQVSYLKMLDLTVISKDKCLDRLRTTRLGPFFQLHNSFLCAYGKMLKETCGGDGGSPLICPVPGIPGRYHQTGIVSWGIGCGENNMPDVYVKVSAFRDWIDEEMLQNEFDITTYRY